MLITFTCEVHHDVVFFGEVGQALLTAMGMSGRVPGALRAEDIPAARASLEAWLERLPEAPAGDEKSGEEAEEEEEASVPMRRRALPLLEMLERAEQEGVMVMWE